MTTKIISLTIIFIIAVTLTGCSLFPSVDTSAPVLKIVNGPKTSEKPTPKDSGEKDNGTISATLVDFQAKIASDSALSIEPETPGTDTSPTVQRPQLEIKSSSIRLSADNKELIIEGELLNKGLVAADLNGFKIIATVYDKASRVLTSGSTITVLKTLDAQATTPFQVTLDRVFGADTYRLQGGF
ncbi:MAG: hypothetical protein AAB486_04805 [Patescibacteria group bacterium]